MQVLRVVEVKRVLTWKFYLERILPVGLFMALTLLFGNIVYLYLTVSFIQMLKASSPHYVHVHVRLHSCACNLCNYSHTMKSD